MPELSGMVAWKNRPLYRDSGLGWDVLEAKVDSAESGLLGSQFVGRAPSTQSRIERTQCIQPVTMYASAYVRPQAEQVFDCGCVASTSVTLTGGPQDPHECVANH